ncbi:hypothetical protein GUITHDRAFT_119893 [Guillardia theta CCMP2712]|uniref:C2 domain-containing protein n=1 Tax=Guillardia theta (strain CCMP2712) TaxID=905079 RepID=L1IDK6_GUITC|nr:hypothetical protein GUITHDRAFT_119893 [Guillardia theta CCMP2712]EKX33910.1 hypothetical protein GUITHDRAFT_119893 [Guillardia theta CCMP2712]|eukprot:XP_005820890.1 hypothetical protein GUITHDRAFT_119893 [Guillardia theta CCMP2712]
MVNFVKRRIRRLLHVATNLRSRLHYYINATRFGVAMDVMNILLSLASVVLYVTTTYYDHPMDVRETSIKFVQTSQNIQDVFLYFFLTEFVLRFYAAENRWTHLRQALTIIDILTVFPPLLILLASNVIQTYDEITQKKGITTEINVASQLGFLRVVCLLRILRVLILLSQENDSDAENPVDGSSGVFFHMIKVLLTFGSVMFCFAGLFMTVEQNYRPDFRIWFHDALYFTVVTVSSVGYGDFSPKSIPGKMLVMTMICFALAFVGDQLNEIMRLLSVDSVYHVVVCGSFSYTTLSDFLDEMFHSDHGEMAKVRELEFAALYVKYLQGSAFEDHDLSRADARGAKCFFILTNKDTDDPKAADQVLCTDEIKLNLLGKSCICPGFSTMISNLIRSSNAEPKDNMETWMQEYVQSCGKEIYRAKLSPFFEGKTFAELANMVFLHLGCTVFAVEIADSKGVSRVVLFPARWEIPSGSTWVFLIGDDIEDAVRLSTFRLVDGCLEPFEHMKEREAIDNHREVQVADGDLCELASVTNARMMRKYQFLDTPVEFGSSPGRASDPWAWKHSEENRQNHVLLCGNINSIQEFVKTLRSKHVASQAIVILFPEIPSPVWWQHLAHFPDVFFVQGTPLDQRDLVRAGVLGLDKAIILSGATSDVRTNGKHAKNSEEEALSRLMDADSIFTYRSILSIHPNANIICQIRNSDNIMFLMQEDRTDSESEITLCPPFAAGHVFLNSVIDRLMSQCMYNEHLLPILRELVISGGVDQSSFLENDVTPSVLYSLIVPSSFEGKTYKELFQYLVSKRSSLPLGLYRKNPTDDVSPRPYVITNPDASLIVNSDDRMFTLLSPENAFNPPLGMLSITSIEAVLPPRLPAGTEGGGGEGEDGLAAGEEERWGCFITIQSQGESQTSHLCRNLTSPHWNFRSDFFVLDKEGSIDLSVHDSKDEKGRSMRFVGVTTISIQDIIQEFLAEHAKSGQGIEDRMIDRWFKLEESKAALSRQGRKRIMLDKARLRLQLRWFPRVAASVEVDLP